MQFIRPSTVTADLLVTRQQWKLVKARTGCHSSPARNVPCPTAVISGPIRHAPAHVLHVWGLLSKTAKSAAFVVHTSFSLTSALSHTPAPQGQIGEPAESMSACLNPVSDNMRAVIICVHV